MAIRPLVLDDLDRQLLDLLQEDADRTLYDLGERVGLSASAVQRRIGRYRPSGLLERQVAVLDPARAGPLVQAVVLVTLVSETVALHGGLAERLRGRPEVQQCYRVAGPWDYVVILTAASVGGCSELGDELFKADRNVRRYETLFVFDRVKADLGVPVSLLHG